MTPTPKNPSRAEALAVLLTFKKRDWKSPPSPFKDFIEKYGEVIEAALATDAPIVEGLDDALKIYDRQVHPGLRNDAVWLHPIVKAAKAYTQGRTQSSPDERMTTWSVPCLMDAFVKENDHEDYPFKGDDYDLALIKYVFEWMEGRHKPSAAPPVTAPIEKVDGLAEAFEAEIGGPDTIEAYFKKWGFGPSNQIWQAARLQLQRQGD